MTSHGERADFLSPFGSPRLFCWEHRNWEAIGLDEKRLADLGGALFAHETHESGVHKGDATLALRFAPASTARSFTPKPTNPAS